MAQSHCATVRSPRMLRWAVTFTFGTKEIWRWPSPLTSTGEVMMGFRTCFHACMSVSLASSVMKGAEAKGLGVNCPGVWKAVVTHCVVTDCIVWMWLCHAKPTHWNMPQQGTSHGWRISVSLVPLSSATASHLPWAGVTCIALAFSFSPQSGP